MSKLFVKRFLTSLSLIKGFLDEMKLKLLFNLFNCIVKKIVGLNEALGINFGLRNEQSYFEFGSRNS